jgi:hypothetical protein
MSARTPDRSRRIGAGAALLALLCAAGLIAAHAVWAWHARNSTGPRCAFFASPGGRGHALGKKDDPFPSFQRLADALAPGQTGCLLTGRYVESPDIHYGGTRTAPVTIRSYPGDQVELDGTLWIQSTAPWVTVESIKLCGAPGPPSCSEAEASAYQKTAIDVSAEHTTLAFDDISDPHGICLVLGTAPSPQGPDGPGDFTDVIDNRIHNCGGTPGSSNKIEGIYDEYSTGSVIERNLIYSNAAMGIQFYPDAQKTVFELNRLWNSGEGVLLGGADGLTSNDNRVEYNIIYDSVARWNIESYWPDGVGHGNIAAHNCLHAHNPRDGGYYELDDGVEPRSQGGIGFRSFDENCSLARDAVRSGVAPGS